MAPGAHLAGPAASQTAPSHVVILDGSAGWEAGRRCRVPARFRTGLSDDAQANRTRALTRRRRSATPATAKPVTIIAQVAGSGTGAPTRAVMLVSDRLA